MMQESLYTLVLHKPFLIPFHPLFPAAVQSPFTSAWPPVGPELVGLSGVGGVGLWVLDWEEVAVTVSD